VLIGSLLVVTFLVARLRAKGADRVEHNLSIVGLGLLAAQILVGALSALESSHTEIADVHLAFATALWGVVVAVFALSARGRAPRAGITAGDRLSNSPEASHAST